MTLSRSDIQRPASSPATLSGHEREAVIYDAILSAYVTGQLPPGTRLPEQQIGEIFGVSRERARKVLHRLAHERWLELAPNRGAVVPRARMEDAREVIQARVVIEAGIIDQLLEQPRLIDGGILHRHLAEEENARLDGDAIRLTRLTAEFHSVMAGFLRNEWISSRLDELVLRSLVFVSLYGEAVGPRFCGHSEHEHIVECLLAHDAAGVRNAMISHIKDMDIFLDFRSERTLTKPLADVFGKTKSNGL